MTQFLGVSVSVNAGVMDSNADANLGLDAHPGWVSLTFAYEPFFLIDGNLAACFVSSINFLAPE